MFPFKIKVCPNHRDKELTPLIFTLAFNDSTLWCPSCGFKTNEIGDDLKVKRSKKIESLRSTYFVNSKEFLEAQLLKNSKEFKDPFSDKRISFKDLPDTKKEEINIKIQKYKYKFKN